MISEQQLEHLTREAERLGATSSAIISSKAIQVKDNLAALCNGEYSCPNYGLAASCPPHVEGPVEFRKWQAQSEYSITVKIELPASVMFSDERKGVMQLLHQIVAAIEQKAVESGFGKSKAFAGGSCKELFCEDQEKCRVVEEKKPCRHMSLCPSIHVRFWYRCHSIDAVFRMAGPKSGKVRFICQGCIELGGGPHHACLNMIILFPGKPGHPFPQPLTHTVGRSLPERG
jgi:predicted metal-binding protein